jgi:peptidyl-prolyl cis-trans isomerase D
MTMLDRMRRHKNWLKWSLAVVVLTFVLLYIPDFVQTTPTGTGAGPREVIAEVDGRTLTAGDFQQRYLTQLQAYRNQLGANVSDQLLQQLGIDKQILAQMLDEQVALIEADRNGISVSDDELAQQIFAIPGLQGENGRFIGEERYEQLLLNQVPPMTKAQFEENLRRSMILDKLRGALTDWMAVSEADVEREYQQRNEKVKMQIVALTADRFRSSVSVTDADVAAHFEAHKAEYRIGEQRRIKYLVFDREQARLKVSVPATDVQRYYNDNIQQYQTPEQVRASHILLKTDGKDEAVVRKQAEAVLQQVKSGADFAGLAKKVSEDEETKANGGDLDYFTRGRMVPEFDTVAFTLQPGQVSDLVKSQFGFHIIKVVDKKAAVTRPLDDVRDQIQSQLALQLSDQRVTAQANEFTSRITDAASLERAARELQLTVQDSGLFRREDPVPGLGAVPQVASAAFALNGTAAGGPVSSPVGPVFFVVSERKDPYVPMLDEVKDRVREDLIRSKATELSRQRAAAIASALKAARGFEAAAKAQGLEAKPTDLVPRGSALPDIGVSPEVDRVAFSLPVGGVSDPIQTTDGTVIVRVSERDDVTPDELRQARETFRAELLSERRGRFFAAYMAKAKERMRIKVNEDVITRLLAAYRL